MNTEKLGCESSKNNDWAILSEYEKEVKTLKQWGIKDGEYFEAGPNFNLVDIRRDFNDGAEIFPGRAADIVCRMPKPSENGEKAYEEVMEIEPVEDIPLEKRFSMFTPEDFPLFSQQTFYKKGEKKIDFWCFDTNNSLSEYVGQTADMIDKINESDAVVYLDKSARPVSWLVNEFWEEFSDEERKPEAFLAIDRLDWFEKVKLDQKDGLVENSDGSERKATFFDFKQCADNFDMSETFAKVRALFIPGGVSEDMTYEEIMNTPTGFEDKKLLIVDEVRNSGTTIDIAKWLLKNALPELETVNTAYFWHLPPLKINDNEPQMNQTPFWYDSKKGARQTGRGVLDISQSFFKQVYRQHPNNYTLAQHLGSEVLGEPMDRNTEPERRSDSLVTEIRKLHEAYRQGHILPNTTNELAIEKMESLGVKYVPSPKIGLPDPHSYISLSKINKDIFIK